MAFVNKPTNLDCWVAYHVRRIGALLLLLVTSLASEQQVSHCMTLYSQMGCHVSILRPQKSRHSIWGKHLSPHPAANHSPRKHVHECTHAYVYSLALEHGASKHDHQVLAVLDRSGLELFLVLLACCRCTGRTRMSSERFFVMLFRYHPSILPLARGSLGVNELLANRCQIPNLLLTIDNDSHRTILHMKGTCTSTMEWKSRLKKAQES